MDNFSRAHAFTAKWEGGLSDHPADGGGITAYGVSLAFLRDLASSRSGRAFLELLNIRGEINQASIRALGREQAERIFRYAFWDALQLDCMPVHLAVAWYDMAVNHGKAGATRMIQQALNNIHKAGLKVDGQSGPLTRQAARKAGIAASLEAVRIRKIFFQNLAAKKPSQKVFLKGWLNRANDLEKFLQSASLTV